MAAGRLQLSSANAGTWRAAAAGLVAAAAIVGVAITVGGTAARALNGVGAILWIVSGVALARSLPEPERRGLGWVAAAVGGLILGGVVRPGTIVEAITGFAIAGALVVLAAGDRSGGWALLVPAIYLPVHLLIGIGRAAILHRGVRTDPPPTAAVLPLVMILAAAVAGVLIASMLRRGR